eukprot:TRINITY_DN6836_c2_g2_i2.p1 TRINITY_DN6836_c2_g2~~TRINITY_DN6836_c2_g2_i2.p1  ORF type:complete len:403 (+),score=80.58 TRINITY_DN6836_c2_g2_i2:60-1268(+)
MRLLVKASIFVVLAAGTATDIYDQPPTTLKGCECTSACQTSVLFHCNVAPFCSVKSKDCAQGSAEWSVTQGYYDWCSFESYKTYEDLQAEDKKKIVLAHVDKDTQSGTYPALTNVLTGILGESVTVSFNASADVFPQKRKKYIHSVGVTGGIRFDSVGGHPYTGLFQGAEHGLIRFSSAKQPVKGGGVAPGMGIKFFRDGRPSANFVAMYSLDGQASEDTDFFQHDWNNHVPLTDNFGLKIIAAKFWQASYCPLMVGLSDLSTDANGKPGVFPFKLNFHSLVSRQCRDDDYAGCLENLENIPVGTKLFEVRAQADPNADEKLIGHITITDSLTKSKFGDEELFFKHQHMEDDYELKPEWLASIDRKAQCGMGCTGTTAPPISKGCSSPFNGTEGMLKDDMVV